MSEIFKGLRVGFCMTGSFCTFEKAFAVMKRLSESGCDILPVMSFCAACSDTRFGKASEHIRLAEQLCKKPVITTIAEAEPIGPKSLTDIMIVAPCTGNTTARLAQGITDTPVTMAVKSHLRGEKPVVLACATNDALAGSFKNIAQLMGRKHFYFVPFGQDDPVKKPASLVADFSLAEQTMAAAMTGKQLQPVLI